MKFFLVCVLFVVACSGEVERYDTITGRDNNQQHVTIEGKFCMGSCKRIFCEGWVDKNTTTGRQSTALDVFSYSSTGRAASCIPSACGRDCAAKKADGASCLGQSPMCCCLFNGAPRIGSISGLLAICVAIFYGKYLI